MSACYELGRRISTRGFESPLKPRVNTRRPDPRMWLIGAVLLICSNARAQTAGVHDPSIVQAGDTFYLFSTGRGIQVRKSKDLFHWDRDGRVFDQLPAWTTPYRGGFDSLWAADISCVDGQYRCYYAASTFGSTHSAIGLVVNTTLDRADPKYKWVDKGMVISTPANGDWNAIDPCGYDDGREMVLGSCWSGIKRVGLDRATGLLADPAARPVGVARHPPTNIIEEGYVRRHGEWWYLFESVDHCCRGVRSDYRIWVGRSKSPGGPFVDFDGKPLTEGGGTLVLAGYGDVHGPGSCATIDGFGRAWMVHHMYDKIGAPTLQVRPLFWSDDGWPVVGEPITRGADVKADRIAPTPGVWKITIDYGIEKPATWAADGDRVKLTTAAGTVTCEVGDDGTWFVGRDKTGRVWRGVKE